MSKIINKVDSKEYEVEIVERLVKVVKIKANNQNEAERIVHEKHRNCEIVLTDEDFQDFEINCIDLLK